MKRFVRFIVLMLVGCISLLPTDSFARPAQKKKTTTQKTLSSKKKTTVSKQKTQTKKKTQPKQETQASLQAKKAEAQQDIRKTKEEISRNEAQVKEGLAALGILNNEITATMAKISNTTQQVKALEGKISTLQTKISEDERLLAKQRDEYRKTVKNMRKQRNQTSAMAFVFASKNFHQAERRIRYLKKFAAWRKRQTEEISARIESLNKQKQQLAEAKTTMDRLLASQKSSQQKLEGQQNRQVAIVDQLKKNGAELRAHLAKRQSEVNQMNSQISALIAQEEQKRQAEIAAKEKATKEKAAAEQAAKERAAAEKAAKEKAAAERAAADKAAKEKAAKEKTAAEKAAKEKAAKEKAAKETAAKGKNTSGNYAEARKRAPRSKNADSQLASNTAVESASSNSNVKPAAPAPAKNVAKSFENFRGQLPKPVSGRFNVVSYFGNHCVDGMPGVCFDNPGVDAVVDKGAVAKAVYGGKVSGVYRIDGYSTVVIVNHGDYYTVYGNLASANVSTGDSVSQGQSIGNVAADPDAPDRAMIHFEVRHGKNKLNPLDWIR